MGAANNPRSDNWNTTTTALNHRHSVPSPVGEGQGGGSEQPAQRQIPKKMSEKLLPHDDPRLITNGRQLRQNMTPAEWRLWQYLRGKRLGGYRFRRQQPLGQYILDFVCVEAKLVIEIDGGQHTGQTAYDETRTQYLQNLGFTVIRFWNNEVLQQTHAVLTAILNKLEERKTK